MNAKIFGFFAENQETPGLAGGAEGIRTPETLSVFDGAGFVPNLAHYSIRKKACVLERIYSPVIRLFFGSLVPFVRYADPQSLVTSDITRTFGVRISPSRAGSQ
jgi:hypothetical protein